jgi:hypothetical protein
VLNTENVNRLLQVLLGNVLAMRASLHRPAKIRSFINGWQRKNRRLPKKRQNKNLELRF